MTSSIPDESSREPSVGRGTLISPLRHPTRRAVLRWMLDNEEPTSPADMARRHDDTISNVGYHFRKLEHDDAICLVASEPIRESIKHYYAPARLVHQNRALVDSVFRIDDALRTTKDPPRQCK